MSLLNDVTIVLFICHVLGDFQFQPQEMSDLKTKFLPVLRKHLVIQSLILTVVPMLFFGWNSFFRIWALLFCVLLGHCSLDLLKFNLKRYDKLTEEILYITDQVLHITFIIFFSEFIFKNNPTPPFIPLEIIKGILLFLVIMKPANITFKMIFQKYHFKTDAETIPGAGAIIGNLERILSAIFLGMNQITAIGFIYTAKSIARFKEIEESKGFAEYYLIGTLFSILYVVVAYLIIIVV